MTYSTLVAHSSELHIIQDNCGSAPNCSQRLNEIGQAFLTEGRRATRFVRRQSGAL